MLVTLLRTSCSLLVAGTALAPTAPVAGELSVGEVLERVRNAVGWEAQGPPARLAGRARFLGVEDDYHLAFDAEGRFRSDVGGRLGESFGWDGEHGWKRDRAGIVRRIQLEELDERRLVHWIQSGYWLAPESPLVVAPATTASTTEAIELQVALPGTPMRMGLTVTSADWLPRRLTRSEESGTIAWELTEWNRVGRTRVPHRVTVTKDGAREDVFELSQGENVRADAKLFAAPRPAFGDARFDPEVGATIEVERTFSGHLLVHPRIDDQDVGWFILDTGAAALVVDAEVADELGMPAFGEVLAVGGAGRVTTRFREGRSLDLGPLRMRAPLFVELDLEFLSGIFGVTVAGICGYDLFARAVVEVEPAGDYVAIHDPARFEASGAPWQELALDEGIPCVDASFEGDRTGLFKIDTGASGTVTFHTPAVDELGLLEGRRTQRARAGGVGGTGDVRLAELAWFQLGPHRFETPTVGLARTVTGALTDRYTLGTLGQDFLSPFRLVLDYPGGRLALVPLD